MASPVEFRHYLRKFTMDDVRNGFTPIKQQIGPVVNGIAPIDLFAPPQLQFRYRERVIVNGETKLEWSDWYDVPLVREGDAPIAEAPPGGQGVA